MKINWKHLATTSGYKSLKQAMINDIQENIDNAKRSGGKSFRSKKEFRKHFYWVISRAKHYAEHHNKPIEKVLNEWENNRNYWWLNYYQSVNQPLLHNAPNMAKPRLITQIMQWVYSPWRKGLKQKATQRIIHQEKYRHAVNLRENAGKKARWSNERKRRNKAKHHV